MIARPERQAGRNGVIQSVSVAARFLSVLSNASGPMALGEIAKLTRTGASTTHRYLQSLVAEGLAVQDAASGRYDLGPAALGIGIAALRRIEPVEVAARRMRTLADSIAASCGVAVWTDRGPTIVRWYRSAHFLLSTVALGDVLPLNNSACGLVFQAFMPSERVKAARAQQPEAFRGRAPDAATLAGIRRTGFAELSEHLLSSVTGKAAAVFDAQGEIACVMTTVSLLNTAGPEGHDAVLQEAALAANIECGSR